VSPRAGTATEFLVAAPQTRARSSGAARGRPVVTTPSLALRPGLQRVGLRGHGSISHASEFDAGGAFGGGRYSVHGWRHPHWLAQIFSTEVRAHVMQPSPMRPSFMGFYVVHITWQPPESHRGMLIDTSPDILRVAHSFFDKPLLSLTRFTRLLKGNLCFVRCAPSTTGPHFPTSRPLV
jgi:hypothetical protein